MGGCELSRLIMPLQLTDQTTVGETRTLLAGLAPDAPVIIRHQRLGFFYLLDAATVLARLQSGAPEASLDTALSLYVYEEVTPALEPEPDYPRPQLILTEAGEVVGLFLPDNLIEEMPVGSAPPEAEPPEAASPPPRAEQQAPFVAYPDLQAPEQVRVAEWFVLTVGLSRERAEGTHGTAIRPPGLADEARFDLELQLMADGFEARDGWRYTLPVERSNPGAHVAEIYLRATPEAAALGRCSLRVHFAYRGQYCGVGWRNLTVLATEAGAGQPAADDWAKRSGGGMTAGTESPVDITLVIDPAQGDSTSDRFTCTVLSPYAEELGLPADSFPVRLQDGRNGPAFAAQLANQVQQRLGTPMVKSTLRGMGDLIAKHLPVQVWEAVRQVALHVRAQCGRDATLLIHSREYHIPWELASFSVDPQRPPFLGAQLVMGRWWHGEEDRAPEPLPAAVPVSALNVIFSAYDNSPGKRRLPHATAEAEFLAKTFQAERVGARLEEVVPLLEGERPAQVLHFACHGATYPTNPGSAELILERPPNLSPVDIRGYRDSFERDRPFVFLNACQVGQAVDLLTANMGFAGAFVESGSTACVAPLWNIVDETARSFVEEFYRRTLAEGAPVGAALRELRARFAEAGGSTAPDPTWLAYVYYGHPGLVLKREG